MREFWGFYQNLDNIRFPFRVFGLSHIAYLAVTIAAIRLLFRSYKRRDQAGRTRWQRGFAIYLFVQEMFFYAWTYFSCKENPLFEVLQLELCTFCLFMDFSTIFHKNQQVRFFGALMGCIGGPVAMIYPATVADVYPVFSYRLINFYMTHGTYILFSLMLLSDRKLLNRERLLKNLGVVACLFTAVYFFDIKFHTQYMFVGTPPEIGIVRMVYDAVGTFLFLPTVIVVFSAVETLMYFVLKRVQRWVYRSEAEEEQAYA